MIVVPEAFVSATISREGNAGLELIRKSKMRSHPSKKSEIFLMGAISFSLF
jgi:hypothetical protein